MANMPAASAASTPTKACSKEVIVSPSGEVVESSGREMHLTGDPAALMIALNAGMDQRGPNAGLLALAWQNGISFAAPSRDYPC